MSHFKFSIPLNKDELLESHAGQYHVEDVVPPRLLLSKLQDAARGYNSEGIDYIFEHFDTYFSIIVHGSKLEWNIINKGFDHILRTVKSICNHLEHILQEKTIDEDVRLKNLNIVKMVMYLFTQIMKTKDTKLAADNSTKLTLGKKGKKATDDDEFCGWTETDKQAALITLYLLLQQPVSNLWDPPLAEDNFVSMVAEPCYKALEEQIIKNKSIRETVFQILGVLIKKYNHGTSCLIKLVQVLQMVEHSVSPICAGVVQLTRDFGLGTFGPQMVREIAEALASTEDDNGGAGTEQGAAKNCGSFLLELTKELPKEMAHAIATIQPYLESDESYTIRISVLGMMCEVLSVELSGEGLSDSQRIQRDDFLDDLYDHMHDLSAYVRHKVLQFWCRLQREGCVPVTRQGGVLRRGAERLRDKAALVRKAAIQLLKIFLECNPFSAQLKLELLEEQLDKEKKILDDLQKKINPGPDPELMTRWEKIEKDVIKTIKDQMDTLTQDEPDLSQSTLDNLYDTIRRCLKEKDYYKAYLIVKHTERQYPDAKLMRCDMERSDQINYFVALLRNMYVIPERRQSITQQCENEVASHKRLEEKESIVAFLEESVNFCRTVSEAVPLINSLLMSKQAGDVGEAIDFFTTAHHFNIESAQEGITNMLTLVWSPDQEKRDAVERAYRSMYLESAGRGPERARAAAAARRLVGAVTRLDAGAALALQHLVDKWVGRGDVTPALVQVFWEMFLKKIDGTTDMDSYAALSLLVMIAKAKPSVALANLEVIQTHGLSGDYNSRVLSAELLLSLAKKNQRYPADHALFASLYDSFVETFLKFNKFTSFAANSINLIYAICDTPEVICTKILAEMYKCIEGTIIKDTENEEEGSFPMELITRFVFVLGHVALQQLIYLDISVYSELRRRNQVREERKADEKRKKKVGAFATPARRGRVDDLRRQTIMNASNASASSRGQRSASIASNRGPSANTTITEEETGLEGAVADDADAEYVRAVCERDIVGANAALARYRPLLRALLTHARARPALQAAAALAYTRYMLVSSTVCEEGLQLMVTVLKRSKNIALRKNLIIAFADLTLRFPNLTQPWTHHIYHILSDEELDIRQCAVKMLSFLVLHEMVRVKGQIADMALCCADRDSQIAAMTKLFFKQLSLKGNALYNVMPDIISRLSDPELNVPEDQYRIIMKYITSLIQKDRQMEALIEKLCQRFKLSTEERQWRDLAYCLSLFTYNERSLRKLIENLDCYKDKLHCSGVLDSFNTLMNNTSKMAKNEIKTLVTELGDKIEECFAVHEKNGDEEEGNRSSGDNPDSRDTRDTRADPRDTRTDTRDTRADIQSRATPRRKPTRRNKRKSSSSADENEPPNQDVTPQSVRKSRRKVAQKSKANDESDESEDEDFQKKPEVFKKPATRKVTRRKI